MKKFLVVFLALLFWVNLAWAEEVEVVEEERTLQGIELLTGFGWGDLKEERDYHLYPLIFDLDFNLKKFTRKIGFNPPMLLQFQLEPYIAGVSKPDPNVEIGNAFVLKVGLLPDTFSVQPYLKAATGMLYMTQHTQEQSTQFNFYEYGAAGLHWFFRKNWAFTAEYRFRHLSNCGIDHPNNGINTSFAVAGISYQF